jgi:hypothetical protein
VAVKVTLLPVVAVDGASSEVLLVVVPGALTIKETAEEVLAA